MQALTGRKSFIASSAGDGFSGGSLCWLASAASLHKVNSESWAVHDVAVLRSNSLFSQVTTREHIPSTPDETKAPITPQLHKHANGLGVGTC